MPENGAGLFSKKKIKEKYIRYEIIKKRKRKQVTRKKRKQVERETNTENLYSAKKLQCFLGALGSGTCRGYVRT